MMNLWCAECTPKEDEPVVGQVTQVMILHKPECKHVPNDVKGKFAKLVTDEAIKKFDKPVGD